MDLIRNTVKIRDEPTAIWPFIEDPEKLPLWDVRILNAEPISWGPRSRGYRYRVTFSVNGQPITDCAEITEYDPPRRLTVRRVPAGRTTRDWVEETYSLEPVRDFTRVTHSFSGHSPRVNLVWIILLRLVDLFEKPRGGESLNRLKQLVEKAYHPNQSRP